MKTLTVLTGEDLKNVIREVLEESGVFSHSVNTVENETPMNQAEAAQFLGISQPTIITWKKEGKIPYEQAPGSSKVRFYKSQLLAAVRQNSHLLQAARN